MRSVRQYLIETDVLIDHLTYNGNSFSYLEIAMMKGVCFTTVLNSSELYFFAKEDFEKEAVDSLMKSLKILGINSRYSLNVSEFFNKVATVRDALFCSVAKNNKLPILTGQTSRYKKTGLKIISLEQLRG
ncbi:PIN domain-containing protein [Melioribacteraceae bacterium 4301-Me]|uniref:PIN domain-containing protein n=1 Tax=Pyranulibacter aquaticus TaxID=3163344 RepID=UPI003595DBE2